MPDTQIVIVGGGAAGLSMAGALAQHGHKAVILDRDSRTGDVWRQRYARLHLHTIRSLSHSPNQKLPKHLPRYVPKDDFADYMEDYAHQQDLDIRHGVTVTRIGQDGDGYQVETTEGDTWHCDICIVATGLNQVPFLPDWEGVNDYQGQLIHAHDHQSGKAFAGQRVLVIGIGNSGAEICADCVEQGAAQVDSSIRTFPTIVKRDPLGVPVHIWGLLMLPLPSVFKDWIINKITRLELGDLKRHGMQAPDWKVFRDSKIPMIDVGYVPQLKAGKITIKPDIERFTETGVIFSDDEAVDYDVVIAATGYRTGLERILDIDGVIDDQGYLINNKGKTPYKGLWFIGYLDSPAGVLMISRIQSQKIAKSIDEQLKASSDSMVS